MWCLTRDPKVRGQNETILNDDASRLKAWRGWLRAVRREGKKAFTASPAHGVWQLSFIVHNFAPALQRVVVEQKQPDDSWRELRSRYTIEFRAEAANPRADLRHPFSVPVSGPDGVFRISLHGLGQVGIEQLTLTNGVRTLTSQSKRKRAILGRSAPKHGFPDIAAPPVAHAILPLTFAGTA
jgi:hypothetical protein